MKAVPFALVALGGGLGACARYAAACAFGARPLTTFYVNVSGALLIGVVAGSAIGTDERWRLFLATGLLGGYTTFSTLALEALTTGRSSGWIAALANLAGSSCAGVAAAAAGIWLGGKLQAW